MFDRLCAVQVSEEGDADFPDGLFERVDDLMGAYGADGIAEIVAEGSGRRPGVGHIADRPVD
ncbi:MULTISPECIES: hypothetical protein [Streptomyces]|uniref:hypothetical protein n=1 Tax=Streptomyces TaxID=1883 RepID=UPI00368967EC